MDKDLDLLYQSLLFCLGQELERYQELLKLTQEEPEILIRSRLEDLQEFNARKERVLLSLQMAASIRLEAQGKITAHLRLKEPVSMRDLTDHTEGEIRQNLLNYQEQFTDLRTQIEKMNKDNQELIAFAISQVSILTNHINKLMSPPPSYNQQGYVTAPKLHGRLLTQEG